MNDKTDAKCSLCWKCKFGLTIEEQEIERILHQDMRNLSSQEDDEDQFDMFNFTSPEDMQLEGPELVEHTMEHTRIRTICYWRPDGVEHAPPNMVANIKQCSRFEDKNAKP